MEQAFAFDETQMLAGGIDAFESEPLANLLKGGNDSFALLIFLKEGIYLRLALGEPIRHGGKNTVTIDSILEKVIHRQTKMSLHAQIRETVNLHQLGLKIVNINHLRMIPSQ